MGPSTGRGTWDGGAERFLLYNVEFEVVMSSRQADVQNTDLGQSTGLRDLGDLAQSQEPPRDPGRLGNLSKATPSPGKSRGAGGDAGAGQLKRKAEGVKQEPSTSVRASGSGTGGSCNNGTGSRYLQDSLLFS